MRICWNNPSDTGLKQVLWASSDPNCSLARLSSPQAQLKHTHTRQLAPSQRPRTNQRRLGGDRPGHFGQLKHLGFWKEGDEAEAAEGEEDPEKKAKDKEKDPNNRQHPKWSSEAVRLLMYAVETNLYRKLANAWKICVHDKRITLSPEDLRLAKDIMQERIDTRFTKTVE